MKKKGPFEWTPEADQAFQDLKRYLTSPPVMVAPRPREPLVLYLAATPYSASAALVVVLEEHQANGASRQATPPAEMTQDQEGTTRAATTNSSESSSAGRRSRTRKGPGKQSSVGGSTASGGTPTPGRRKPHQRAYPHRALGILRQHGVAGCKSKVPHASEAPTRAPGGLM